MSRPNQTVFLISATITSDETSATKSKPRQNARSLPRYIGVIFEKEHIFTLDSKGEVLFSIFKFLSPRRSPGLLKYSLRQIFPKGYCIIRVIV